MKCCIFVEIQVWDTSFATMLDSFTALPCNTYDAGYYEFNLESYMTTYSEFNANTSTN